MKILGISSATKVVSIGLIDDDQVLLETTIADMAAEKIVFYVEAAGIKPEQIEGIAVAQGPGSYSGLRGGLATAKSLAQTLKVPLVGVSTLAAIAYNLIDFEGTMAVKLDARMDEFNFALFGAHQGQLKRLTDDLVLTEAKIKEFLSNVTGELKVVDGSKYHPYGINVARLGLLKIKAGETADPLKLVPQYSHMPNIRVFKTS
ncbi:tRNA (adenosine(37)-N6)-threonylcarbamoyltransferase complex dimerization subunit type 1 TsaB [candidate division WOR-1 bacterium RIFOXYB2_FULL_42_35]|uniref:tRNA (Adenosine(37)-N6)-threonylcarbamoyltransferase complex dimerization subunit type 1 TsaB n=1 Tax=candidate division WOR-1 bacterium RIFOXYC2_FULL_41_25 TaxID=1802586 RepID=A0A1F4TRE2_UNCSA|nr:MAG: tRNA (adenosine(37)-N6)-threonylcarbamoyltransferase complex dimerization subunit type 1 TsaB [candidate division WOR-1 bacterium RIFOXYB2_FULL_42_35]OGC24578.1 MAG: tRNA (adenosine(37)-N6)-threonylcarbamoyltransferase complex dimerization subunit type 1 TsaB [candidate division WOR-1 bacterium RIFOXYA2_FULL_41_14]OGC34623.1 MAG: tRNA (adenosine(37)-N6)-threonylcarbamoyltransferase complex dimerization subunit type 1 TsaB [candidate division WOR-1 bacterium RIFOXYC2_FULL_41_25]OGC42095.1